MVDIIKIGSGALAVVLVSSWCAGYFSAHNFMGAFFISVLVLTVYLLVLILALLAIFN